MPKPKYHAFICTNQRPDGHPKGCCYERKSMDVWQKFAEILNQKQVYDKVQISGVRSCLGPCQFGPVVIVYPEAIWYGSVQPEDVEEIFESHFENGKPLERLLIPQEIFG